MIIITIIIIIIIIKEKEGKKNIVEGEEMVFAVVDEVVVIGDGDGMF